MLNDLKENVGKLRSDFLSYIQAETDYLKLTAAEKLVRIATTILFGTLIVATIWFMALLMSFALAQFLSNFLPGWAAYLCTAGAFLIFLLLVFLLRKPLIMNPMSKAISRELFKKHDNGIED